MSNQKTQTPIDERKCEMLDALFRAVPDSGEEDGSDTTEEKSTAISATIGKLVKHFRTLLKKVEENLPENTRFCSAGSLSSNAERTGHMVKALQDATSDILHKGLYDADYAHDNRETLRVAYENTCEALEHFYTTKGLANAADLHKSVGQAVVVVPEDLLTDNELYKTFLEEIKEKDDLRDKNILLQTVLSFARKHDRKKIAINATKFDSKICQRFIVDNFDWICEGASGGWIIDMILGVEEIRNDHVKMEKLWKKLSEEDVMSISLFVDDNKLKCSKEFARYLAKWALLNLSSVKDNIDLRYLALVAADEDFPGLVDELEKRAAWRDIAYCRVRTHGADRRHYAQKILDRNVNNIPTSLDFESHSCELDEGTDSDDANPPSIFAIIGTIGLEERARLSAVEKVRRDGKLIEKSIDYIPQQILKTIIKGHSRYRNTAVEEAARKALNELEQLKQ